MPINSNVPIVKRMQTVVAEARRQWTATSPRAGRAVMPSTAGAAPVTGPVLAPSAAAVAAVRAVDGDRLLQQPVFVMSSIRSGSTLLRVLLNAHSQIYAPHELHLSGLGVSMRGKYVPKAMLELGLDEQLLQYLLWDRLLQREMTRRGKSVLVNKTPSDALMWRRIVECWPDVRFIFLLRHPASIADSWHRARKIKDWSLERAAADVLRYMDAVEEARDLHPGLTIRYEDITTHPDREMRRVCEFVGVDWEPAMLDYGAAKDNQGPHRVGLGDWSARIKSGKVQPIDKLPEPDEIPPELIAISKKWGYLPG